MESPLPDELYLYVYQLYNPCSSFITNSSNKKMVYKFRLPASSQDVSYSHHHQNRRPNQYRTSRGVLGAMLDIVLEIVWGSITGSSCHPYT